MTVVDHAMTWSPENKARSCGSAKARWFIVCPGGRNSLEHVAVALDALAVGEHARRRIVEIVGRRRALGLVGVRRAEGMVRRAADDRRTGRRCERPRGRRVVTVRVSDHDLRHALAGQRGGQRRDVLRQVGAGIDHRHRAMADDIGVGALEGHRPRVRRRHAADERRQRHEPSGLAVEIRLDRQRLVAHVGSLNSSKSSAGFGDGGGRKTRDSAW